MATIIDGNPINNNANGCGTIPRKSSDLTFSSLVSSSEAFQKLKRELQIAVKLSLTGITNLVVNHEGQCLVDELLKASFKIEELYNNTYDIDAVELQHGQAGNGNAYNYLDELIYGSIEVEEDKDLGIPVPKIDPQTGKRKRISNGFINRRELIRGATCKDRLLIIKNVDFSLDFCSKENAGIIEPKALNLFDNFRDPITKNSCRILLVSNVKIKLPFQIRTLEISPVDDHEANHLIDSFMDLYTNSKYIIDFSKNQKEQIARKLCGLTYNEAGDVLAASLFAAEDPPRSKNINSIIAIKKIRQSINQKFMDDGFGLTQLTARPWEDYICPETSNFTWDVKKLLRDFNEVKSLRNKSLEAIERGEDESEYEDLIERIQTRMPHVMVLYGQGGVGKCLGRGTKIVMFNGTKKNVEDVVVGDVLMGPDSRPRNVLSTTSGLDNLYNVVQNNGCNYICNGNHILSLKKEGKYNDSPVYVSVNDYFSMSKTWKKTHYGWKSGVEFDNRDVPIDPYWFGLWLGDGTAKKPAITVHPNDIETFEWLEDWSKLQKLFIRYEKKNDTDALVLNFSKRKGSGYSINPIKNSLRYMDVFDNKHIPELYLINSREKRLSLLAGLIDSDGYMGRGGSLQFYNINKRLAENVADLGRSLGFKVFETSSIKTLKSKNYSVRCYIVTFGGNLSEIPIKLPRKQGHDNTQKIGVKCGINIDKCGFGEYYGFTIDGDRQFLLGDYTVTHNSAFPVHLAGLLGFDIWDFNVNSVHSKFVGQGSEQARNSIKSIMNSSHVIVRIDEYDRAMGATNNSADGMHEAHKQVESEFMSWLQNGQEENEFMKRNIFVVMTTNHKENITGPMLRSGRVDLVINIDNFDSKSMKETFKTTGRRMNNRGVKALGFMTPQELQTAIDSLDLDQISELCTMKGFTVRDIETLVMEMAAYNYYFHHGDPESLEWTTDNFVAVLENSQGSMKEDGTTGELVLGDREVLTNKNKNHYTSHPELDFDSNSSDETKRNIGFVEL